MTTETTTETTETIKETKASKGATPTTGETLDIKRFLSSMRLDTEVSDLVPMVSNHLETVTENVRDEDNLFGDGCGIDEYRL